MLNVHLNGDLVRCPDMETIQEQLKTKRKKENKCAYGICMHECNTWKNYNKEKQLSACKKWDQNQYIKSIVQPCTLKGDVICPMHRARKDTGNMEKTYTIDSKIYRKLSSAGHYMVKNSKNKTIFFTLTFPSFKKETNEKELNERFSRFMENLRKTYKCEYYIAVREYGETNFRVHYHVLCSIPYINFTLLNDIWNNTIQDLCYYSKSAFTTKKDNVILRDPGKAFRYCCKYFSKARGYISRSRIVFMSTPLVLRPYKRRGTSSVELLAALNDTYKSIYVQQLEYVTIFRLTDEAEFDDFCNRYLYDLFGIFNGKTDFEGIIKAVGNTQDN